MRLIKMTGGLGNQMFIYAFYMKMKRLYPDTRIDLSDMVHYHAHHGYELHRIFPHLPNDEFCINQALKKTVEFLFFRTIIERKQPQDAQDAFWRPHRWPLVYFKGFYQSERFFQDIIPEVRAAFRFTDALGNEQTRLLLQQMGTQENSVSLHVRRGDYQLPKFYASIGCVCSEQYYQDAIDHVLQHVREPHFYVFSDDMEWVRAHLQVPNATYVSHNQGTDSWQDMMLMSRCRHNIISNSTFSWWGAWLNDNPHKFVLCPDKWAATYDMPYIIPHQWTKIPVQLPDNS